jgi:hypothetical protein
MRVELSSVYERWRWKEREDERQTDSLLLGLYYGVDKTRVSISIVSAYPHGL